MEIRFKFIENLARALADREPPSALTETAAPAAIADSLLRLRAGDRPRRRFAVLSPTPPDETGIAYATVKTFRRCEGGADIFSRFSDIQAYAAFASEAAREENGFEVFDVASFPLALGTRRYDAIVVALGNSFHNHFLCGCLTHFARFPSPVPVFIYAHDPFLLDLWDWFAKRQGGSAVSDLRTFYGKSNLLRPFAVDLASAVRHGVSGLSAVLRDVAVAGVIVNSAAAAEIVSADLTSAKRELPVLVGFHPVFEAPHAARAASSDGRLRLGSFGVPAHRKRTETVLAAFETLTQRGVDCRLTLAGFGVDKYMAGRRVGDASKLCLVNSPGDARLMALMADVDVAIQLRLHATAESSGVVSQLVAMGQPVVVSAVGAFKDFGNAVVQAPPDATPQIVAEAVLRAHADRVGLSERARAYAASRSPAKFLDWLGTALEETRRNAGGLLVNRL